MNLYQLYDDDGKEFKFDLLAEKPATALQFGYYVRFNFSSDDQFSDRGFILSWTTSEPTVERIQLEDECELVFHPKANTHLIAK